MHRVQRWCASTLWGVALALSWLNPPAAQAQPSVSAANSTTYTVDSDGLLRSWGNDWWGQLGIGRKLRNDQPQQVLTGFATTPQAGSRATLAIYNMHAAAVQADGALLTWGRNDFGQLGNGGRTDTSRPTVVGQGFAAVACGETFTLALDRSGRLFRLQNGEFTLLPGGPWSGIAAQGSLALALKGDGELWAWGQQWNAQGRLDYGATPVLLGVGFADLAIGIDHVLALKTDGSLWGWGGNDWRQLGIDGGFRASPTLIARGPFKTLHAGWRDSAALEANGTVWAWGASWGATPQAVAQGFEALTPSGDLLALRADGSAWHVLTSAPGQAAQLVQVPGRYAVLGSGAANNVMAVGTEGSLYAWGADNAGQLGLGSAVVQTLPRAVGPGWRQLSASPAAARAAGLKSDGTLWEFGGYQGDMTTPQPMAAFPGAGYVAVAAGGSHTLAVRGDGSLWAAGRNDKGQLGDGTTLARDTAVQIGSGFKAVAAGFDHSLGLKTDGSVWAWGSNGTGQVGDGSTTDRLSPVKVGDGFAAVFAHAGRSFALDTSAAVWGWGQNDQGQIGNGSALDQARPVRINGRFRTLAPGPHHTLALGEDGRLWAWGSNVWRAFGVPEPTFADRPTQIGQERWLALAAGDFHSTGMRADGSLWSWGWNLSGALGTGTFLEYLEAPRPVLNEAGTDQLDLTPATPIDPANRLLPYFAVAQKSGIDLQARLTDLRAAGLSGEVYFSVLLPKDSPLLASCSAPPCSAAPRKRRADASAGSGMVAGVLTRQGFKQTGSSTATATPAYNGNLASAAALDVYRAVTSDPLAQSQALICMGVTVPELSAKGQVLMLPIATGSEVKSAVQCPPVQTAATVARFRAEATGPITARTIVTEITPLPEERGTQRKIFSWAVTPDGRQYMQTGPGVWVPMADTMQPAATVTLPLSGPYRFETTNALNLSQLLGTLVFVGVGESWDDVRNLNKAAQHHTVQ